MSDSPEANQARKSSWVTLLYYYLAALTGLVIVIVGAIMAVNSGVDAIFFEPPAQPSAEQNVYCYDCPNDRGDALEDALKGALTAAVGFPIFLWHIRNARRKEDER
jgi:hypothetical protein